MNLQQIKRAVISVSDKLGLADFASGLHRAGVEIFSTGGTGRHLQEHGIPVQDISAYTGFPEMLDGRVKTLHPKVFGGILGRLDHPDDMESLAEHAINPFELVAVNLYPFEATVARSHTTHEEAVEQIDIGGPSLIRAAAKNFAFVTVATDPSQYAEVLAQIVANGTTSMRLRQQLAAAAFARTAEYDRAIAIFFAQQEDPSEFPATLRPILRRKAVLRYGENPHQRAALYAHQIQSEANLVTARKLNGKELSYNNLLDMDAALEIVRSFEAPSVAVIKHNNPCGAALAEKLAVATQRALDGDSISAFGSVLGFNRPVDVESAEVLSAPGLFVEAIVAPSFDDAALEILTTRPKWRANVRLMQVGDLSEPAHVLHYRQIDGGLLVQEADWGRDPEDQWRVSTEQEPTDRQRDEMRFAWAIVRHVKSNAIVLTRDRALWGIGAGQMSRIDSVDIALAKAGSKADGAVLASDAFFPFPDSIHRAAKAGVSAIIQPGGSKGDDEVIAASNEYKIPMIFTGRRHFKH